MKYIILLTLSWLFIETLLPDSVISIAETTAQNEISPNEIASWFPNCEIGDTVKVCIKSLYWRNGYGIPYSWVTPQPQGTAYGTPMEFNFFDNCDSPCGIGGAGDQHVFLINLFEGESEQVEIVIGWGLDYGLVWHAPSIVCGEPAPLGTPARFAILDQDCNNYFYPSGPIGACPVTQFDCSCPSCPSTPPPDTSNYMYSYGAQQGCKIIYCPT